MVKYGNKLESSRKDHRLADTDNIYDKRIGEMQETINQKIASISPADEEDLTRTYDEEGREVTKFADRSYAPEKFSGKGYKILRKNIKPVSLAVTKIVVTTAPTADGYLSFIINGTEIHVDVVSSTDTTPAAVAQKIATKLTDTMEEYEVSVDASTITLTRKFGGTVTASSFSANATGASCTIADSTKKEFRNLITSVMVSQPNTIYEIRYDFDLNGTTLEIPEGCTLKFEGGMLRNGVICLNNTYIKNAYNSFSTKIIGSIKNEKISTAWVESLCLLCCNFINKTISIDKEETIIKPLVLENTQNCKVCGNYMKISNIGCGVIELKGQFSNIEIFNFLVDGLSSNNSFFVYNKSSAGTKEYISIHDNYIFNQSLGISLNADLDGLYRYSKVYNNILENIVGTEAGSGYGIHFANVRYSEIYNNTIIRAQRHSIYHAWGRHNKICRNRIINHRKDVEFTTRAALAIFRRSTDIVISDNYFENTEGVDIHLYASTNKKDDEQNTEKYKELSEIQILGNTFLHDKDGSYCVMVGYNALDNYDDYVCHEKNILIRDNIFTLHNSTGCILFSADNVCIERNKFILGKNNKALFLSKKYLDSFDGFTMFANNTISCEANRTDLNVVQAFSEKYARQKYSIFANTLLGNRESREKYFQLYLNDFIKNYPSVQTNNVFFNAEDKPSKGYYIEGDIVYTYTFGEQLAFKCAQSGEPGVWWQIMRGMPTSWYSDLGSFDNIKLSLGQRYNCGGTLGIQTTDGVKNALGQNVYFKRFGNLADIPMIADMNKPLSVGSTYFCKDLNKLLLWNGFIWMDSDGNPSDCKNIGTTAERPSNVQIGYIYKDTTLNKLIVWDGSSWVNMDGTALA